MSRRHNACHKLQTLIATAFWPFCLRCRTRWFSLLLILFLLFSLLCLPAAAEQIVTKIVLNQEEKGDFFVHRTDAGDFLISTADLSAMGFRKPDGAVTLVEGEPFQSLQSLVGVDFVYDENTLSLLVTASPDLLAMKVIDFKSSSAQKVYYPKDSSLFLNYGFDYQAGNSFSFASLNFANQLGVRKNDFLFLSDSNFISDKSRARLVRLQSAIIKDDRKELQRFVAGDFFASSGELGSALNLGGISFSKIYRIDPYFVNYPTVNFSGQVALPSEANIYLNGMQVKTEKLSPGQFELRNMSYYGGAGVVDIVIKDMFGREQRLQYPFYYGDSFLLKQGLHEYSYNLGFIRERFGIESNRYSKPAFSGFHRYGVSDTHTLGFMAEAKKDLYNLGYRATLLPGRVGIFSLALAGSTGRGSNTGGGGIATYLYQGFHTGARLSLAGFTRDYSNIAMETVLEKTKYQASAGVSYHSKVFGSLSFDYTTTTKYVGQDLQVATIGYNRSLTRDMSLTAIYKRNKRQDYSNDFFVSLNYTPKFDLFFSASHETIKDMKTDLVDVQKNPPVGEGLGYRASLIKSDFGKETTYSLSPSLQYNARYGIYRGDYTNVTTSAQTLEQYHLSVSGALVYAGKTFGLTRPVYDSFGLVQVGNLEGVKVLLNSQEVGVTDSSGKLFIPSLGSYYQNQVGISDKEIPIDYYLSQVVKLVSPPLRSGSCINFAAKKLQSIMGILKIKVDGAINPLELYEISLLVQGREVTFPTGTGGEFYLDISQSEELKKQADDEEEGCRSLAGTDIFLKPGSYRAKVIYKDKPYSFSLTIPNSEDSMIELGEIIVDAAAAETPVHHEQEPASTGEDLQPVHGEPPCLPIAPAPEATVKWQTPFLPAQVRPEEKDMILTAGTSVAESQAVAGELSPVEVHFRFGTAEFASSNDQSILTTASRLMKLVPDVRVAITGYTDQIGSQRYNLLLSKKRAQAVATGLKKLGLSEERILNINWFGKKHLKCFSLEESCRKHNRRVIIQYTQGP